MSGYTTEEIRYGFAAGTCGDGSHMSISEAAAESKEDFDRWLAAHDAEVRADAWIEGHAAGRDYQGDGWNSDAHDPEEDNPYRTQRIETT